MNGQSGCLTKTILMEDKEWRNFFYSHHILKQRLRQQRKLSRGLSPGEVNSDLF